MEKEKVINDFRKVIAYSQNIDNPKVEELIEKSLAAKKYFIDIFGDLIFEVPEEVSFELSNAEKVSRLVQFCDLLESSYYCQYELAHFISEQREDFYNNRVHSNYMMRNGTVIPEGMKILKAFRYFEEDERTLRKLQDMASNLIQEDKITGTLCFSVHPLDFLSSSENNHKWRSCHALDGEYRAGNLSYMVDSCTFMVYLKSDEKTILPNFPESVPWNNKKWRTLMFIDDNKDMMFAGRQYPFSSDSGIEFVKSLITKYFPQMGRWTEWRKDKIKSYNTGIEPISLTSPYVGVGNKLISMKTLVKDGDPSYPLHFNDLLKSSCYDPMYSYLVKPTIYSYYTGTYRDGIATSSSSRFVIGGKVKCLCCGQKNIDMTEIMTCTDCELQYGMSDSESFSYCPHCGERFIVDDGCFVDACNELVCQTCYDEEVASCCICGDCDYIENMSYDEDENNYVCSRCCE